MRGDLGRRGDAVRRRRAGEAAIFARDADARRRRGDTAPPKIFLTRPSPLDAYCAASDVSMVTPDATWVSASAVPTPPLPVY